ncbi:hypothetical protein ElyMa_003407100 [Elysia marginata]|uniref:Uncharacterized protein n=1 Tax=Elysia marginata TaxID=1093978 RepID=A0AAV4JQZ8_9GAST|nr:hypothetical protein ElyMa_003407100 [Elysia marginata]
MRGADAGTDHNLVLAKLRLKLKRHVIVNYGKRLKFQVILLQGTNKRTEFQVELKNKFQLLSEIEPEDIDPQWNRIKDSMLATCSSVLGHRYKDWITQETLDKI